MTAEEAGKLIKRLIAVFPRTPVTEATVAEYMRVLLVLPLAVVEAKFDLLLMGHHRADRDQPFFPEVNDFLEGLGIVGDAHRALADALREGGTLEPSLRAVSHWEHVRPDGPIPQGVVEAMLVDGREPPPGRAVAPLPTPRPDRVAAFGTLAAQLKERKMVALRRVVDGPKPEEPLALEDPRIPPALLAALEAAEGERRHYLRLKTELAELIAAHRAIQQAEVETLEIGAPTLEAALAAIERLVARVVNDPLGGLEAATEAFRRGAAPGLVTRRLRAVLAPPSLVDLDGLDGPPERRPIEGLAITFAKEGSG
jgi:hypothetical protein